jgi:hypothetical protein
MPYDSPRYQLEQWAGALRDGLSQLVARPAGVAAAVIADRIARGQEFVTASSIDLIRPDLQRPPTEADQRHHWALGVIAATAVGAREVARIPGRLSERTREAAPRSRYVGRVSLSGFTQYREEPRSW